MSDLAPSDAQKIIDLVTSYSFDLGNQAPERVVAEWLSRYSLVWVRLAIIEALYQGRYKAVSVQQILMLWERREGPIYHFNSEFARIVASPVPRNLQSDRGGATVPDEQSLKGRLQTLRSQAQVRLTAAPIASPAARAGASSSGSSASAPTAKMSQATPPDSSMKIAPPVNPIQQFTPAGPTPFYTKLQAVASDRLDDDLPPLDD
jgi:hypothetical protein